MILNTLQTELMHSKDISTIMVSNRREGKTTALVLKLLELVRLSPEKSILGLFPNRNIQDTFVNYLDTQVTNDKFLQYKKATNYSVRRDINSSTCYFVSDFRACCGQYADYIFIDEFDFIDDESRRIIRPIIEGDKFQKACPRVYAATSMRDVKSFNIEWLLPREDYRYVIKAK